MEFIVQRNFYSVIHVCTLYNHNALDIYYLVIHDIRQPETHKLQQACCPAVIKPISGCVHIANSGLMTTSLLH